MPAPFVAENFKRNFLKQRPPYFVNNVHFTNKSTSQFFFKIYTYKRARAIIVADKGATSDLQRGVSRKLAAFCFSKLIANTQHRHILTLANFHV